MFVFVLMWMCVSKEISSWVLLVGIFMTMILKILCKTALAFQQQLFVDISQGNFTEICAPAIQLGTTFIFYANYTTQLKMCNKNYMHSNVRKICTYFYYFSQKKLLKLCVAHILEFLNEIASQNRIIQLILMFSD